MIERDSMLCRLEQYLKPYTIEAGLGNVTKSLATTYRSAGDYEAALAEYRSATSIFQEIGTKVR